jgi:hypothetical protein
MKRFRVNKGLYLILPIIMILIIAIYLIVLYKKSYTWINVTNLILDILILVIYLIKFPYEASIDNEGINFYTLFRKYREKLLDIQEIRQASFLTKIETKKRSFYVLTTLNGRYILYNMFKDIKK